MEDSLDFQIDFENLNDMPDMLVDQEPQEDEFYNEILQGDKKVYLCTASRCGKIFKFKSEITRHVIIHQKDRPYVCSYPECKKNFKRADALENHMRIHAGILPFPCDIAGCDRSFVTKAALRYHKIRHNNNRSFKCDFLGCDKSFIVASQLKQHYKAFPFHRDGSIQTFVEEVPIKIHKGESKVHVKTNCCEELIPPTSNPCDNIQWEVKTQGHENLNENTQEKFEMIFQHILNENKILKEQLQEGKKQKEVSKKNDQLDFEYDEPIQSAKANEPSIFFDDNELEFLEFLKGRENLNF